MSQLADVRVSSASPVSTRGLPRWVCTNNPFYVISAGLFLEGLWISFGGRGAATDTWALMTGLAGYTLLLAVTAFLLVRYAKVWDDARTVLLLVALMFLATSVTFDEVFNVDPARGTVCYVASLVFAIGVSETLLRGIRLVMPLGYRIPYYLILALFFLYPIALHPLLANPYSETAAWGLFAFCPAAGLVFLTLLPAIRRGADYVRDNGSPWRWPLYPWALFTFLGLAVPARAFLLCWSLHWLGGMDQDRLLIGPYFLVPFGFAIAVLLLEIGIVSGRRGASLAALALPVGLVLLARVGHRPELVYQTFLARFADRLGGDPLFLTVLAATGFYAYAALRRVPHAADALTGALVALAYVGPEVLTTGLRNPPRSEPIFLAAALQLALGLWRENSARCLLGTLGQAAAVTLAIPDQSVFLRGTASFHLLLFAVLLVGAAYEDPFARMLRVAGAVLMLAASLATMIVPYAQLGVVPPWAVDAYPLLLAALLVAYGLMLGHRFSVATALAILICWLLETARQGYVVLREVVVGLDHLAISLTLFAVAVLISLGKAGILRRWLALWRGQAIQPTE